MKFEQTIDSLTTEVLLDAKFYFVTGRLHKIFDQSRESRYWMWARMMNSTGNRSIIVCVTSSLSREFRISQEYTNYDSEVKDMYRADLKRMPESIVNRDVYSIYDRTLKRC